MKTFIILVVFTAIILLVAGCGPGQPFEIEECIASQAGSDIQVSAAS